jgi:hypothetical protein
MSEALFSQSDSLKKQFISKDTATLAKWNYIDSMPIPPSRPLVQSPFYDAMALYYTIKGYKAYPLLANNTSTGGSLNTDKLPVFDPKGSGPPLPPFADPFTCFIIECATGKVLNEITGDNTALELEMDKYFYDNTEAPERNAVLDSILVRNLSTPLQAGFTHHDIMLHYLANPNIAQLLNDTISLTTNTRIKFRDFRFSILKQSPAFSNTGGERSAITTLIEGYTDFLIERVNEEFNDAFLVHLYHALHSVPEFGVLFPNTLASLDKIELTQYSASLNAIKTAYQNDIQSILSHLSGLATLRRYRHLLATHNELTLLFVAADILDGIHKKNAPAQLLRQLGEAPYITGVHPNNYSSVVKMSALLSNSLRDVRQGNESPEKEGWINDEQLKYLLSDTALFNLFTGLLIEGAEGIVFTSATDTFYFKKALVDNNDAIRAGHFIVYNFTQTANKINTIAQGLRNTEGKTLKPSDYVNGFISLAKELLGLSQNCLAVLPTSSTSQKVSGIIKRANEEWTPVLKQADTVLVHVENKDYQMAIYSADQLLQRVLDSCSKDLPADSVRPKKDLEKLRNGFLHYGLFIASIAGAKSPAEVKAAISTFALPKGSSRIKKERCFTVGLNAYVGVYHAVNHSYPGLKLPSTEWGITAPLGVGMSFGLSPKIGNSHVPFSLGLYGGILDVGAIFTYKVQGGDTLISDIQLGQIFSPSATVILGLPIIHKYNIPIAIGANIQWGPKLHKVGDAGNSLLPLLVKRYMVFLAFDLPILNFYTSRKQTKHL